MSGVVVCNQTWDVGPTLVYCWANVVDGGTTVSIHGNGVVYYENGVLCGIEESAAINVCVNAYNNHSYFW